MTPGAKSTALAQTPSEKLNQSNGVIHPKEMDRAIEKPAPNALDSPGGAAAPQPK
jgi:hypothetical protein